MGRTVLDVDRELLRQAQEILGEKTLTGTIDAALRAVVAREALRQLIEITASWDDEQRAAVAAARDRW